MQRIEFKIPFAFLLVVALMITALAQAQETVPITLEKVLELSGANNLTIKEYQERQKLANAKVSKAKEWWLPEAYGGAQTQQLWGAAMNSNGNFFLDVNSNNLWLGLGVNVNWKFADGLSNLKASKLERRSSDYLSIAERNKVLLKSIEAYYNLMTAQLNLVAYKNLVTQSASIIEQMQVQVEVGLIYQSELLLAKSNKNHLQIEMLNANKDYNVASAELLRLLNIEQQVQLVSVDSMLIPLDYSEKLVETSDTIYKQRPEIKANELEIQALQVRKKSYTSGLLIPELNIGTYSSYYGKLNGKVTPMNTTSYPNPNQLYPTQAISASLLWKIPIGALTYRGDAKKYNSLIRLKEIEDQQFKAVINEEIANARVKIHLGKEQIETAKEAMNFTTEALKQSIERQKLGTAKPFEVFQAQEFYLKSQIDYSEAISTFNKAQFELKVAKGELL